MLNASQINTIEAKASTVLESVFGNLENMSPPIDILDILKKYEINLKSGSFEDKNVSGLYDKDKRLIYIADDESPNRKAFTVAHELGHFFLHTDKTTDLFYRMQILNLTDEHRKDEQEANWFAASLLMPEKLVKHYFSITNDVDKLTTVFGVSPTAVYYRLKNLGLVS